MTAVEPTPDDLGPGPVKLTPDDLAPFAKIERRKAEEMIADALGLAKTIAPCIFEEDFEDAAGAKAILRSAVLRWNSTGVGGGVSQQVAGPYSQALDTRVPRQPLFWPSEIVRLQAMCDEDEGGAYGIDTVGSSGYGIEHADICNINFGADYCSCGAVLTGRAALWERND